MPAILIEFMKMILNIGGKTWLCESAALAAKISDLLGTCQPVEQFYDAGSDPSVYLEKAGYGHEVRIEQVTEKMLITKSKEKVAEMVKKNRDTERQ